LLYIRYAQLRFHGGPKKYFWNIRWPYWLIFSYFHDVFIKNQAKINKILGFAGRIDNFRGPHLATLIIYYQLKNELSTKQLSLIFVPRSMKSIFQMFCKILQWTWTIGDRAWARWVMLLNWETRVQIPAQTKIFKWKMAELGTIQYFIWNAPFNWINALSQSMVMY